MGSKARVEVTAIEFDHNMQVYPRRIEVNGVVHYFIGRGKHTTIKSGASITRFYRMTDGVRDYHLKNEAGDWVLL